MRIAMPPKIAPEAFLRRNPAARIGRFGGDALGTNWSALVVGPPDGIAVRLIGVLDGVAAEMSQWRPDSALSRFNRSNLGQWRQLPPDFAHVLSAALALSRATDGAFDPTLGALVDLWGFGPPGSRSAPPDDAEIEEARKRCGADAIEQDGDRFRRTREVALDLSGIAKGFAVDALARHLRAEGCEDFLVEAGGEYVGAGVKPDGQPWWVDLEDPPGMILAPLRVAAHRLAVATSGDYRRFIASGDRRLGHTIHPRAGRPIDNGVVSVTVIADDCMTADAWATALTILGPDAVTDCADADAVAFRMVLMDGRELLSPALEAMLA